MSMSYFSEIGELLLSTASSILKAACEILEVPISEFEKLPISRGVDKF